MKTWYFIAAIMRDILGWSRDADGRGFPQIILAHLHPCICIPVAFAVIF
jgi:hypothetical protein